MCAAGRYYAVVVLLYWRIGSVIEAASIIVFNKYDIAILQHTHSFGVLVIFHCRT